MRRVTIRLALTLLTLGVGVAVIGLWAFQRPPDPEQVPAPQTELGYDKARYDRMRSVIDTWIEGSKGKTLMIPFAEAERQLSLEGVQWSEAYTSVPRGEARIYHFRGFYLDLELDKRLPDNPPFWTSEDIEKRGQWYVYHFHPALFIDGLDDPEQRMNRYRAAMSESFRRRDEEGKRSRNVEERERGRRRGRSSQ